ncbi:hypothetical protein [Bremerella alba]|uniref:Uncharacterized protein n=1 Tax=Bremerella alba TaxID=980252 RepID=A0A7V8VA97_9BACT|nr:hypothetical protein [Bremerella alba]MBA2117844.1 hypothetical protein [Bremerella alba]
MKSSEVDIETISALLYDFNQVLCRLLELEHARNPKSGDKYLNLINEFSDLKKKKQRFASVSEFAEIAIDAQSKLSRLGYRPSAKKADSIVGVLMRFASSATPDNIHREAKGFATAVGLIDVKDLGSQLQPNLVAVLFRPTNPQDNPAVNAMRDVVLSIFLASQLTTAAAHADSYGLFSLRLLEGVSKHLVDVLESIVRVFSQRAELLEQN